MNKYDWMAKENFVGPYCPAPGSDYIRDRVKAGRYKFSEHGILMTKCSTDGRFHPADTTNFPAARGESAGLGARCKKHQNEACKRSRNRRLGIQQEKPTAKSRCPVLCRVTGNCRGACNTDHTPSWRHTHA